MATEHLKLTKREELSRPLDISEFDGNLSKIDAAFETAPKGEDENIDFTLLVSGAQSSTTVTSTVTEQKIQSELKLSTSENNILQVKEDGLFASASAGGTPEGGTTGQLLAKNSNTSYDVGWIDSYKNFGLGSRAMRVNGDWNDIVLGGWYDGQGLVNSPAPGWVNMMVCPAEDPAFLTQIAFHMFDNWRWIRHKMDGIWGEWQQLATMDLVLPKDGGIMNGDIQMADAFHSINARHFEGTVKNENGELYLNFHNHKNVIFGPSKAKYDGTSGAFSAPDFITTSDERKKKDITSFESETLHQSLCVQSVSFRWKDTGATAFGVIAQRVEKLLPEVVHTDAQGYKSVSYAALHSIQIQALIEEHKTLIEEHKTLIEEHKTLIEENNALKSRLTALEQKMETQCQ